MTRLQSRVGRLPDWSLGVTLIWQRHLDAVQIPPGFPHAVTNLQPCVKVACDGVQIDSLPWFAEMQNTMGRRFGYGRQNPADYVELSDRCFARLLGLRNDVLRFPTSL
jgi:hypothetical protein